MKDKNELMKCKRDIARYLLEYMNKSYDREDLKFIDSVVYSNGNTSYIFVLSLNESFNYVKIVLSKSNYDLNFGWGKSNCISLYDDTNVKFLSDDEIKMIYDIRDKLADILYNYQNNQNIKPKNDLISKVSKICNLLTDRKHYSNEYVLIDFGENDYTLTIKFSDEKNIKLLIKDNIYFYYTFHGTWIEYEKWTPSALDKITKIINNILSNIREIEPHDIGKIVYLSPENTKESDNYSEKYQSKFEEIDERITNLEDNINNQLKSDKSSNEIENLLLII